MKRRDFIKECTVAAGGILLGHPAFYSQPEEIPYKDARTYPEKRQEYLDGLMTVRGKEYPYTKGIVYNEDPGALVMEKVIEMMAKNGNRPPFVSVDSSNLARNYSLVFMPMADEFGLGGKSDVYVFPFAFDNLSENELRFNIGHEDFHCQDISEGIKISGGDVDLMLLDRAAVNPLMEMRAYNSDMIRFLTAFHNKDHDVISDVRLSSYVEDVILSHYGKFYGDLKHKLENDDISNYTRDVIREHLITMSKWILPEFRYMK